MPSGRAAAHVARMGPTPLNVRVELQRVGHVRTVVQRRRRPGKGRGRILGDRRGRPRKRPPRPSLSQSSCPGLGIVGQLSSGSQTPSLSISGQPQLGVGSVGQGSQTSPIPSESVSLVGIYRKAVVRPVYEDRILLPRVVTGQLSIASPSTEQPHVGLGSSRGATGSHAIADPVVESTGIDQSGTPSPSASADVAHTRRRSVSSWSGFTA